MSNKLKEIATWLLSQGTEITREVLEEKLQEAYHQGQLDAYHEQVNATLDNILVNTMLNIKQRKQELLERNFYQVPPEEDIIQMRALEYLSENISKIVKEYRNS